MFIVRKSRLESAEFAQLVSCCRPHGQGQGAMRVAEDLDWNVFIALARRHRVQGIAWRALHSVRANVPPAIADVLCEEAKAIAQHGMQSAAESARLLEALSAAGVPVLFLKGLTVGRLAYGDAFVKMSWDIDILVDVVTIGVAAEQLRALGYELVLPAPGGVEGLQRWHRNSKESHWYNDANGLHLELHTRLTDNPQLLAGITQRSAQQMVEVAPGISLPTLAQDELFAYLCVHGSSSAWFRLKWLADFVALSQHCDRAQITSLYERSHELGGGRAAAQALLLARDFFGTALESDLSRELEGHRANRQLARIAYAQILQSDEPTQRRLGTATIHSSQFLLHQGLRFKIGELRRQLREGIRNAFRAWRVGSATGRARPRPWIHGGAP